MRRAANDRHQLLGRILPSWLVRLINHGRGPWNPRIMKFERVPANESVEQETLRYARYWKDNWKAPR